ncbi:GPI transamidase component GPI16, putative [Babesia caballi]|uniref:GPI transamidase component GPI16, putative n=1 Tax=Babesia caballi TaxID=5871 RepID=A0AAV4LLD3_BABCB|nr:GPI transamidase component GPI16, putative [Babesia caballi]
MDVLPPDFAKLFLRTHVDSFECTQHMGDWHSAWGSSQFPVFTHGETLWATWPSRYTHLEVYDFFETLATNLWGITGSQLQVLTSRNAFVFDMTRVATLEEPISSQQKPKSLMSSFSEDAFCVDNLYKWRTMMPSLGRDGLLSLINDERVWARSPYKGVQSRMFRHKRELTLSVQFQLVVLRKFLSKGIWAPYRGSVAPRKLLDASSSAVEILLPEPLRNSFGGSERLIFDFHDLNQHQTIADAFNGIAALTIGGFRCPCTPPLTFSVSELESTVLDVQRRVQSSLSIVIENNESVDKYVKFVQPLPYWMVPRISTLTFEVLRSRPSHTSALLYSCSSGTCFKRLAAREKHLYAYDLMATQTESLREVTPGSFVDMIRHVNDQKNGLDLSRDFGSDLIGDLSTPLMVLERSDYWIEFGFSIRLPALSRIQCRVDLQKNKMRFSEIDYAMHRGQLIHSGVILESLTSDFEDIAHLDARVHHTGAFFSQVILPDNTMTFNVMAGVGVVIGLLFGLVFNVSTAKPFWERKEPSSKKRD